MTNPIPPWERQITPRKRFLGAVWRILAQSAISWVLLMMFGIAYVISPTLWGNNESLVAMREITKLAMFTISVFVVVKLFGEDNLTTLGFKWDKSAVKDFLIGVLITFVVLGMAFLIYIQLGWIRIYSSIWQTQPDVPVLLYLLGTFVIFIFVGWSEELLSRGFHLQVIERGMNRFWGVFLSSLIFSLLHKNNPGMNWIGLIQIFINGLIFAYAFLKTGRLWLAMGLHAGWDFFVVVAFFGTSIGNMRIFHLFELQTATRVTDVEFGIGNLLTLAALAYLTRAYLFLRNKKDQVAIPGESEVVAPINTVE
jgi:uncharacterized protein